tara:strand:+ start:5271 stop:5423 length:153 start_codon:yes stop_codon:yes gene_type:complete
MDNIQDCSICSYFKKIFKKAPKNAETNHHTKKYKTKIERLRIKYSKYAQK